VELTILFICLLKSVFQVILFFLFFIKLQLSSVVILTDSAYLLRLIMSILYIVVMVLLLVAVCI
jgi:hypothetical protein